MLAYSSSIGNPKCMQPSKKPAAVVVIPSHKTPSPCEEVKRRSFHSSCIERSLLRVPVERVSDHVQTGCEERTSTHHNNTADDEESESTAGESASSVVDGARCGGDWCTGTACGRGGVGCAVGSGASGVCVALGGDGADGESQREDGSEELHLEVWLWCVVWWKRR